MIASRSSVPPTTVDAVAERLREQVLTEEIPPGVQVTESLVASRFGIARPTARAAIDRLVQEGLFRRSAHASARVPQLTATDINDLYFARGCIDREVARGLADRRTVPPQAHAALVDLLAATNQSPLLDIVAADINFHRALTDGLGSTRLTSLYNSLMGEVRLCMAQVQSKGLLTPRSIYDEHVIIASEIASGNSERAAEVVTTHLEHARVALLKNLENQDAQTSARPD
ncbi:GntR family transcriptional regulator [Saccharopolyspora sp. K220]|uniref:GntR family transcriptional regulator n=1 Tax=Saccharopolyspora soli TaxID=2926618 RepID=UPI001F56D329|nr:GntR family transcriptional regulator [Saccharopolyspora soli]MCI2420882.1 GntR family transcriptional regulator [Saccharopolyspora soli]